MTNFDSQLQQILMDQKHGRIRTDEAIVKIKELFSGANA